MSPGQDLLAVLLALLALYGLGLPIALLLPAPNDAQWVHRVAIAPLLGIAISYPTALLLGGLSVRLHPVQLLAGLIALWALALLRRDTWGSRPQVREMALPTALISVGAVTWVASLWGYGLYLPNRDFKYHATFVADVASSGVAGFTGYPLGLHTILGWALPTSTWNSVGVTAAAAFLAMSITMPLAMLTLARLLDPAQPLLGGLAGLSAVLLPGAAGAFGIGSVPILVGTACYAAANAALWMWFRQPTRGTSVALVLSWAGLLFLHVSEAVALALVLLAGLPVLAWRHRDALAAARMLQSLAVVVTIGVVGVLYLRPNIPVLSSPAAWDVEPNVFGPVEAMVVAFTKAVTDQNLTGLLWLPLVAAGVWIAHVRRLSWFPVVMLLVPMGLAVVAGVPWAPDWLRASSAPWYGAIGRIAYLASPPVLLLGSLTLLALLARAQRMSRQAVAVAAGAGLGLLIAIPAQTTVDQRREQLFGALAGAGDTSRIAEDLAGRLQPGETALAFEGDGGALLYAHARVPLVGVAIRVRPGVAIAGAEALAFQGLGDVGRPPVARVMADLGVRYVVLGTTSLYWDQQWGITLDQLTSQPEFSVVMRGTDVTVLRYEEVLR